MKHANRCVGVVGLGLLLAACAKPSSAESEDRLGVAYDELGNPTLPNWATPDEIEQASRAPRATRRVTAPPAEGFRVPAEYEPVKAVVMTWTSYTTMLRATAVAAANAGAEVWVVGGPTSISGVPAEKYRPLSLGFNSVWMRDYGPTGINVATGEVGLVDSTYRHYATRTSDDSLPCHIAQATGAACFSTDLIIDGGNFMIDEVGNVFFTRRLYEWNANKTQAEVDRLLRTYYGAKQLHPLDYAKSGGQPADGTGHIDMFVKLLGSCKVMVAQADAAPFKAPTDAAAAYFAALDCPTGGKYQVFRTPGWSDFGTWYTYTNALFVNQTVVVPSYQGADNEAARAVYQAALPGYTVSLVNSDASITAGGSIHCVTQQVPASSVVNPPSAPPPPPPGAEQAATDVPLPIPDADLNGVTSSLSFASAATVASAWVSVEIAHSYLGDLQVILTCPEGNSVVLHDRSGGGTVNLSQTYPVSACDGQSAQGVWKLKVVDTARRDVGTLTGWKVRIGN